LGGIAMRTADTAVIHSPDLDRLAREGIRLTDGRSTPGPRQPNTPASARRQRTSIPDENPPVGTD